ncbi:hypothetical protein [Cellulosimicrobium sp. NPDC057862]|uniref:hypothetical protein n=1 Tax=Actinomycetes TaxID=1760 RepID=UPI00367228CD
MTENTQELRDAVADAQQQITERESDVRDCISSWRREFVAAVEPAMLNQARRYFEEFPVVAKTLDADGVKRLKGTVRANAARVAEDASARITLERIDASHQLIADFRLDLLRHVAKAMAESLQPTFTWNNWFDEHQRAAMPHAHFDDVEELDAYQRLSKTLNELRAAQAQHSELQTRLDRAEALDLWDSPEP